MTGAAFLRPLTVQDPGADAGAIPGRRRSIHSERLTGEVIVAGRETARMVLEVKRPGMVRLEVDSSRGPYRAGFDGTTAWQSSPSLAGGRTIPLSLNLARQVAELVDIDGPLESWRRSGFDVRPPTGDGPRRTVSAAGPDGITRELEISGERPVRWEGTIGEGRRGRRVEIRFEDYADVEGATFPFCVSAGAPGEAPRIVVELSKVEIDPEVDDIWFAPPPSPPN